METSISRPRRVSSLAIAAGLLTIGGIIYCLGDERRPVPAAAGTLLSGQAASRQLGRSTLRVATFNIHGGVGRDGCADLARTADVLKDFDLILLNEVHGPYFWQRLGQAEQLARLTSNHWLFAPTEERWWHHQFGNALLASANVRWWQRVPLPSGNRGHRNLVLTEIEHRGETVHIVATHLDRNDAVARGTQLAAATELFLALAEPVILMGDLNTTADEASLASLLTRSDVHDPLQEAVDEKVPRHIDWILTRGLKTLDAGLIDNGASDHPLAWAELAVDIGRTSHSEQTTHREAPIRH